MNGNFLIFFGVVSAITNTAGLIPYILDILGRKTKPERATWWIWSALSLIAFSAQIDAGATWSLAMTGAQLLAVVMIAFLSLKYGFGSFHKKDFISLLLAFFGILLWKVTDSPIMALIVVVLVDVMALYLTVIKTWKNPETETLVAWVLGTASGVCGLIAVGDWDLTKLIYPAYIALADGLLAWIIFSRRKAKV